MTCLTDAWACHCGELRGWLRQRVGNPAEVEDLLQDLFLKALRQLFQLLEGEQAVCCLNVGTAHKRKPARLLPDVSAFVSSL